MAAEPPVVTLISDFGLADWYVATMKGVMLDICPALRIVDVSHDIRPQQVEQAAFVSQNAWPYFPRGSIHVAVVDPGVGTSRLGLLVQDGQATYIGPDNGVLSAAIPDNHRPGSPGRVTRPPGMKAYSLTNRRYLLEPVSSTFHGRDVFAPVAAHVACGVAAHALGDEVSDIFALPALRASASQDGSLSGRVLHIDYFGNVITDIRSEDVPEGPFVIELGNGLVEGPIGTYAEGAGVSALAGSSGYLEIAVPNGRAADTLGVSIGDSALLRRRP
jgi:S-adenosylmethionine hydrolase